MDRLQWEIWSLTTPDAIAPSDLEVFFASTFWRKLQRKMEKVESPKWRILQMSRAGVFQPGIYKHSSVFTGYMKVDTYGKIQQTVALHR